MKHLCLWKPAALCAVAALLVAADTYAQDGEDARGAVEALRTEAVERVTEMLERRMVREVSEARVESDARSIARGLSAEQLDELVRGRDVNARIETMKLRVAVSGGELQAISEAAVGNPESDLLFVPVEPCRIIDTRLAGGPIAPGAANRRHFEVAGTENFLAQGGKAGGCNIPLGATVPQAAAAVINFIAVSPAGPGNLRAWEFGQPEPLASIINYANVPGLNIANGVIVPIAGVATLDKDLTIQADAQGTQVVADVTGYFTRFPIEQFQGGLKSTVDQADFTTIIALSNGACHQLNTCSVTSPTAGTVIVEGWGQFVVNHTAGTVDRVAIGIETVDPVVCSDGGGDSINASDYEVPAALGTNADVDFTLSHGRSFSQAAGVTRTYRLSGRMLSGANTGDEIENSRLICTFIPD